MEKCKTCYPDARTWESLSKALGHPFEVSIKNIKHIAYNVIPGRDSYQTWCTIEFSLEKMKTYPKVGVIGIEPVDILAEVLLKRFGEQIQN